MFQAPQVGPIGSPTQPYAAHIAAVDPAGNIHLLTVDASGNLQVGNAQELAKLTVIANSPALGLTLGSKLSSASFPVVLASDQTSIPMTSGMGAAAKAGTAFSATTGRVALPTLALATTEVIVGLFQNPGSSTKSAYLDVRQLSANVSGVFSVYRDPTVSNVGSVPIAVVNELAGSATTPQAKLYQGGGSTPVAVTSSGTLQKVTVIGSTGTDREQVASKEILPAGHSLLVTFLPYTLLAFATFAYCGFDWSEA